MKFVIGHAQADEGAARAVALAANEKCLMFPVQEGLDDVVFGDHLIRIALWTPLITDPGLGSAMERFLLNGNLRRIAVLFPDAPPLSSGLNDAGQIVLNWGDDFQRDFGGAMRVLTSSKFGVGLESVMVRKKR